MALLKESTFTAPKAYITIEGQPAGYIRNITFTENIQRQPIRGLGNLYPQDLPAVSATNTFNLDMFFLDFGRPIMQKLLNRLGGKEALLNTLALGDLPISINIYKKLIVTTNPLTKLVTSIVNAGQEVAILRDCYINSQNWTLAEGGIASTGVSGEYLSPVTFNI
jgi:hypothetical protein